MIRSPLLEDLLTKTSYNVILICRVIYLRHHNEEDHQCYSVFCFHFKSSSFKEMQPHKPNGFKKVKYSLIHPRWGEFALDT